MHIPTYPQVNTLKQPSRTQSQTTSVAAQATSPEELAASPETGRHGPAAVLRRYLTPARRFASSIASNCSRVRWMRPSPLPTVTPPSSSTIVP